MALSCGFFNHVNGDRAYNTEQISQVFDGIINDGIFQSIGTAMMVEAASGMTITIGIGRAWFNSTWTLVDAPYPIDVPVSEVILDRIDAVVLKVDHTEAVRNNTIEVISGTPSSEPSRPVLVDEDEIHYHVLAYIYVAAGVNEITQSNITNNVGTDDVPFVTGILQTISASQLITQWAAEWVEWLSSIQNEGAYFMQQQEAAFQDWFSNLQYVLDGDVAGHLQNEIDAITTRLAVAEQTAGKDLGPRTFASGQSSFTIQDSSILSTSIVDVIMEDDDAWFYDLEPAGECFDGYFVVSVADPITSAAHVRNINVKNPPLS